MARPLLPLACGSSPLACYDPAHPATGCHRARLAHGVQLPPVDVALLALGPTAMAWVVWVGSLPVVTFRGEPPGDAVLLRDYNGAAYVFWAGVLQFTMPARARLLQ